MSHAKAVAIDVDGGNDEQYNLETIQDDKKDGSLENDFSSAPKKSGGRKAKIYKRSSKKKKYFCIKASIYKRNK